jgi:hypothetical protein
LCEVYVLQVMASLLYWAYLSDTLLVLWYLLQMYRAARRWTISIFLMNSDVRGSQIEHEYSNFGLTSTWYTWVFICWFDVEYSNFGLTSTWYTWVFICWFDVFMFCFKKPSLNTALLPFDVNVVDVFIPFEVRLYCYTKIFSWAHRFKYMVMEDVMMLYWLLLFSGPDSTEHLSGWKSLALAIWRLHQDPVVIYYHLALFKSFRCEHSLFALIKSALIWGKFGKSKICKVEKSAIPEPFWLFQWFKCISKKVKSTSEKKTVFGKFCEHTVTWNPNNKMKGKKRYKWLDRLKEILLTVFMVLGKASRPFT